MLRSHKTINFSNTRNVKNGLNKLNLECTNIYKILILELAQNKTFFTSEWNSPFS
jgi:hypothetical protein